MGCGSCLKVVGWERQVEAAAACAAAASIHAGVQAGNCRRPAAPAATHPVLPLPSLRWRQPGWAPLPLRAPASAHPSCRRRETERGRRGCCWRCTGWRQTSRPAEQGAPEAKQAAAKASGISSVQPAALQRSVASPRRERMVPRLPPSGWVRLRSRLRQQASAAGFSSSRPGSEAASHRLEEVGGHRAAQGGVVIQTPAWHQHQMWLSRCPAWRSPAQRCPARPCSVLVPGQAKARGAQAGSLAGSHLAKAQVGTPHRPGLGDLACRREHRGAGRSCGAPWMS